MANRCTKRVWELDLNHSEQLVMLALAEYGDADGTSIFPGMREVAWRCGYSDRQIRRIIQTFLDRNYLVLEETDYGSYGTNRYSINWYSIPAKEQMTRRPNGRPLGETAPKREDAVSSSLEPEKLQDISKHGDISEKLQDIQEKLQDISEKHEDTLDAAYQLTNQQEENQQQYQENSKRLVNAGAQEKSPLQIERASVGASGLRSFIASEAEKSPNIRQAIYDAACGVMDKNKLTADQSKQLTDFCDRYIGDTRLDVALVEYARGVCRDGDKRNLKYFYSIMSERLESDEWFGIDVERLIAEQEKQQKREEYRNGKQNGNSAIRGQRPFGNAKHQQNEASLREEMGYRANRRNGSDNHQVEIPR